MFDFILNQQLQDHHFEQNIEWLIDGFLAKNLITLIYASGGNGKSWLSAAIAKQAAQEMKVLYIDYDTGLKTLSTRGLKHKLIDPSPSLHYVHRGSATMRPNEMLDALEAQAVAGKYHNTLIILDSLRNFADINNDGKAMAVMNQIMNLREAGATVLIISHANKDGRNYQGSNNIFNSLDNMYRLTKLEAPNTQQIRWLLNVEKERVEISDLAFDFKLDDLTLLPIDLNVAQMTPEEKEFTTSIIAQIEKQPGINKKELLEAIGKDKRDKTANARLEQFDGTYWQAKINNRTYSYYPI